MLPQAQPGATILAKINGVILLEIYFLQNCKLPISHPQRDTLT